MLYNACYLDTTEISYYILNSHCRAYTCMYYIIYIYLAIVTCMLNGMEIKYLTNKKNKNKKQKQKYKVACVCFNAIDGYGRAYLSELLHVYTPSRTLRSSSDTRMLKIHRYKRKTHGFHTFSCFVPHMCTLPQDLRHCSALSSFKATLKTFFSQFHFSRQPI